MKLVLLLLLGVPGVAHADPVTAWVATTFAVSATTAAIVTQIAFTLGAAVFGRSQQKRQLKKMRDAQRAAMLASLEDRTTTKITTEAYHRTVYGKTKVGGNVVAMFTTGDNDEFKHLVVVMANHEIEAYHDIYIADKLVGPLDVDGWVTTGTFVKGDTESTNASYTGTYTLPSGYVDGSAKVYAVGSDGTTQSANTNQPLAFSVSGLTLSSDNATPAIVSYQYRNSGDRRVRIQKHLGTPGDPADPVLMGLVPEKWTVDHKLSGHAYLVITLHLSQPEFQGGVPSIAAVISGKKLYDPRTSLTTWSDNNALVALDYLTGPYVGVPLSAIPMADYIAAANDCEDQVGTPARDRYTFNGTIDSSEEPRRVLDAIADSMCGTIDGTTWSIYTGKYRSPVASLSQDDIVGNLSISSGPSRSEIYNTVRGQFLAVANSYVTTDYKPFVNTAYREVDGEELPLDLTLPYTDNQQQVWDIARIQMEDQRNGLSMVADFSYKAWRLRPGDRVWFTSPLLGMTNKVFRVTDKSYKIGRPINLSLKEDSAEIWDQASAVLEDQTPNTDLPDPFSIPMVANLAAESGTSLLFRTGSGDIINRMRVSWQPMTYFGTALVEIQIRRHVDSTWEVATLPSSDSSTIFSSVLDSEGYVIRARFVNPSLGVRSEWSYVDHTVVGKSEPPPDVTGVQIAGDVLSWPPVAVLDLAGYIIKYQLGTNTNWNTAFPLHTGIITESPWALVTPLSGTNTFMIKAVDTSGNESVNAAVVITDLGDAEIANVVQVIDLDAMSYPGTVTGGALSGGDLVASALDSFYGSDADSFYGSDSDSLYEASSYGTLVYETAELTVDSALTGSTMFLDITTVNAGSTTVEYRLTGPGSMYGADGDSFYGADGDSFYGAPGPWQAWPGSMGATNAGFQFRVTVTSAGGAATIQTMSLTIDAPDMEETVDDLAVSSSGTTIPTTKSFTAITNIQATLQANLSGGETVEIDKVNRIVRVYNSSHVAVSGATVDLIVKGY